MIGQIGGDNDAIGIEASKNALVKDRGQKASIIAGHEILERAKR